MEKKITFSAEDKGVATYMERMKRNAEQLGRDMIRDARAYTTSGQEVVKVLEEQIRAMEKRNRVDSQLRRSDLEGRYQAGTISDKSYKQGVTELRQGTNEDRVQISLLRELIETTKLNAKEELRSDRKNVEEQIRASKTAEKLNPEGDELRIMKESIQKSELARVKKDEVEEQFWSQATKGKIAGGVNMFMGAAMAPNAFQAGAHMMPAMTSLITSNVIAQAVVGGISGLLSKGFESAQAYEKGLTGLSQISGLSYNSFDDGVAYRNAKDKQNAANNIRGQVASQMGRRGVIDPNDPRARMGTGSMGNQEANFLLDMADKMDKGKANSNSIERAMTLDKFYSEAERMGYKRDEILGIAGSTARSGGRLNLNRSLEVARVGRATGLDLNQLQGFNKTIRNNVSGGGVESITQDLVQGLRGRGAMNDTSTLPEYMQLLTQLGQQQVQLLGKVDMGINTKVISAFADLSTDFKNQPEVLGGIIKSMQGGLGESGNKNIRALQYGVLSRIAPGKSSFQYRKIMEQASVGQGEYYEQYQAEMKDLAGKLGGGNEDRTSAYTAALFGGMSLTNAEKVAKAKLNFKGIKGAGIDMTKMSGEGFGLGTIDKSAATFTNWFEKHGEEVTQFVNTMVEGFGKLVGYSKEVNNNMTSSLTKVNNNSEMLKEWKKANGLN